jgi:hypothetical protein
MVETPAVAGLIEFAGGFLTVKARRVTPQPIPSKNLYKLFYLILLNQNRGDQVTYLYL